MLNLIGEGLAKGTKKALQETAEEVGENAAAKVAKKLAKETGESALSKIVSKTPVAASDIADGKLSKLIEKAKNYKTPERFEKMNNPIKGSEIWGDKPTSAFQRDSRAVRVNMFPNEAVKGTGMTKQYLLNMLKDAYDQGITSIVPSYGIYTKEGASFMDHLAEQGWLNAATGGGGYKSYSIAPKIQEWEKTTPLEDIFQQAHTLKSKGPSLVNLTKSSDRLTTPYLMSVEPDFIPDYDTRMTIDKLRDSAKRVGSKDVAKVDKKTLPVGWKELKKRMDIDYMDNKIAKLAGKSDIHDVTLSDMNRILDDMGYGVDQELIKRDGIQAATYNALKDALDDEMAIDLQVKGGRAAADFLKARSGAVRGVMSSPEDFYFGNNGRAGYLDAELSDRLGIGRSNTPLSDDLNDYIAKDVAGDYFATGIGLKPSELLRGENELSTLAHERLHSFQHTAGEYDPGVKQAYDELHDALAPYKMNEDQMKAYLEGNGKLADADTLGYYVKDREQEARMFQEFLERAGYTKTGKFTLPSRLTGGKEFDEGIDTPFNQFLLKLRTLSKAGIALPAVGLALLLGENYNNKKKEG